MTLKSRICERLIRRAPQIAAPADYFEGRRRTRAALPDNVLLFWRRDAAELMPVEVSSGFHQRWVLVVALRGSGTVLLDRKPNALAPGRALLIPPLHLHAYAEVAARPRWLFATFEWPGRVAAGVRAGTCALGAAGLRETRALMTAWGGKDTDGLDTAVALHRLLARLYPEHDDAEAGAAAGGGDPWLEKLREAAEALPPGASLAAVARRAGVSESHLRARFRVAAGLSAGRYLRETRLRRAAEWLGEEGLSVKVAAERAGFRDIYAFSRAFKRALGVPPSEMRRAGTKTAQPAEGPSKRRR